MKIDDIIKAAETKIAIDQALYESQPAITKWWQKRKALNRCGKSFGIKRKFLESNENYNERILRGCNDNGKAKEINGSNESQWINP